MMSKWNNSSNYRTANSWCGNALRTSSPDNHFAQTLLNGWGIMMILLFVIIAFALYLFWKNSKAIPYIPAHKYLSLMTDTELRAELDHTQIKHDLQTEVDELRKQIEDLKIK